jgi:hypothetical protein
MRYTRVLILLMAIAIPVITMAGAPLPQIPKGKGDHCVEDTEYMRKNHMEVILHHRGETVHEGIRTKKHSLKNCIECHAVKDENNQFVSVASPKHFCRVCHDYASVKIDCFQCHASKPRAAFATSSLGKIND